MGTDRKDAREDIKQDQAGGGLADYGGQGTAYGGQGTAGGGRDRGERFDEEQGGGRGDDEIGRDQRAHQDRGQSEAGSE